MVNVKLGIKKERCNFDSATTKNRSDNTTVRRAACITSHDAFNMK